MVRNRKSVCSFPADEEPEKPQFYRRSKEEADRDFRNGILERGPGIEVRVHPNDHTKEVVIKWDTGKRKRYVRARRWHLCDDLVDIFAWGEPRTRKEEPPQDKEPQDEERQDGGAQGDNPPGASRKLTNRKTIDLLPPGKWCLKPFPAFFYLSAGPS